MKEIVSWLLDNFDLELETIEKINGMAEGIDHPETARMYPHLFKGEGQFVAKFRYLGRESSCQNPFQKGPIICGAKEMVAGVF